MINSTKAFKELICQAFKTFKLLYLFFFYLKDDITNNADILRNERSLKKIKKEERENEG